MYAKHSGLYPSVARKECRSCLGSLTHSWSVRPSPVLCWGRSILDVNLGLPGLCDVIFRFPFLKQRLFPRIVLPQYSLSPSLELQCISSVSTHLTSLQHQFLLSLKKTCSEQAHLSPSRGYTVKPCSDSGVSLCVGASLVPGIKTPSHFSSQDYNPCLAPSPYAMVGTDPWEKVGAVSLLLVATVLWCPFISIKHLLYMFCLML